MMRDALHRWLAVGSCWIGATFGCGVGGTGAAGPVADGSSGSGSSGGASGPTDGSAPSVGDTGLDGTGSGKSDVPPSDRPARVVLVILDDFGVVSAEAYVDQWNPSRVAPTPVFNSICEGGVRFTHAWSSPTCSTTRSTMLTGRYAFRTGTGAALPTGAPIDPEAQTLPRVIASSNLAVRLANIGKWHLGTRPELMGDRAPNLMGWEHYAGSLEGQLADYFVWDRTVDGMTSEVEGYATTMNVDDAAAFVSTVREGEGVLLWFAINAPHTPLHTPPAPLYDGPPLDGDLDRYEAMLTAADRELGRLLESFDDDGDGRPDDTWVIVVGDNGTGSGGSESAPNAATMPPNYEALEGKATLAEHGSRVPLCIMGPGVVSPGRDVDHLVNLVDMYATILDLVGVPVPPGAGEDSVSMRPYLVADDTPARRPWIQTEQFAAVGPPIGLFTGVAMRDERYRVVLRPSALPAVDFTEECYEIENDLFEMNDLAGGPDDLCASLREAALSLVCSEPDSPWSEWCE